MRSKQILLFRHIFLYILVIASTGNVATATAQGASKLIFIGKVKQVSENPSPKAISGGVLTVYREAKYEIISVLKGHLNRSEVTVATIVITGDELDELRIGDKALISLFRKISPKERDKNSSLNNAEFMGSVMMVDCRR